MNQSSFELRLVLNGRDVIADVDVRTLAVEALRDAFGVKSPKAGCMTGDCGACTVLIDGAVEKACLRLAVSASGATVDTLEGDGPDRCMIELKQAFWDEHAFQCGYCLSGMLWCAWELLQSNPDPTDAEIRTAIAGNLCRCTGYVKIVVAVQTAAARLRAGLTGDGVTDPPGARDSLSSSNVER